MATTFLSKTLSSTTNRRTFTFSAWIKRSRISNADATQMLFGTYTDSSNRFEIGFHNANNIVVKEKLSGTTNIDFTTNRLLRDPSAWLNLVVAVDTTQSTESNRLKIYVNGTQETSFADSNYPDQNYDTLVNVSGRTYTVGQEGNNSYYFDGSMTHVHFIDGTQYAASDFGETDSTSGIWIPKTAPSVTYGTNGFFLKFENSGAMGTDSSGNSNTFTVSGTLTQNVDTPTNNYPTLNPLAPSQDNRTGGNGNLYTGGNSNNSWSSHPATMACESGKWYFEIKDESDWGSTSDSTRRYGIVNLGVSVNQARASATDVRFSDATSGYAYMNASGVRNGGSTIGGSTGTHPTFAEGDFIMVAMDLDNNKLYFGKNGTWLDSGNPASGASGTGAVATLAAGAWAAYLEVKYGSDTASINFGQGYFRTASAGSNADANGHGKFKYTVPSGYYAICTKNIKEFG